MENPDLMNTSSDKWNNRYRDAQAPGSPATILADNLHLLPAAGEALELACGLGANALLLADQGLTTTAWDLSEVAVSKLRRFASQQHLSIQAEARDIQPHHLQPASYDVICVSAFLERQLCPAITAALRPGGLLFYQTFTRLKVHEGGPSNPDFLLATGELLTLFSSLSPVVYREEADCGDISRGLRNQACLIARKPT